MIIAKFSCVRSLLCGYQRHWLSWLEQTALYVLTADFIRRKSSGSISLTNGHASREDKKHLELQNILHVRHQMEKKG